jgi:hypothetical protein
VTKPSDSARNLVEIALATVAAVCFAVTFGYTYGIDNQVEYMISSLRLLDPSIFHRDWYAMQTTHYHFSFKYLAAALIALDRRGWVVAGFHTLIVSAGMMCLYWLFRTLVKPGRALPGFLLLVAIAMITRTSAANASYVFDIMLQPSTVGSAAFFASVPFFARGRWLESGALMALSGLFHGNLLILMFMAYGVAHLMLGTRGLALRLALQFALPALVLLLFLPIMLKSAGSPNAAASQDIYFNIRCPHHFLPGRAEAAYIPFAAWQMIGVGASLHLLRTEGNARRLGALIGGLLFVIWSALVLATLVTVKPVVQLFAWRLGPYCELLLQVLACAGAVELFLDPGSIRRRGVASLGLIITGVGFLAMHQGDITKPALAVLVLAIVGVVLVAQLGSLATSHLAPARLRSPLRRFWEHSGPAVALVAAIGCVVPTAVPLLSSVRQRSTLFTGFGKDETDLYDWMRLRTPKDALFLTPPDIDKVRFQSQRAIVADWKSCPFLPDEVLEWHQRMKDVTGRPGFAGARDLDGYNSLDQARLEALRAKYNLDFVVVRRGKEAALGDHRVAHQNGAFVVLDLHAAR